MSREYHLITPERPSTRAFVRTLTEALGHEFDLDGDFEDPNSYLNVSAQDLWIEIEPPGHVEAIDLAKIHRDAALPQPDDEGCLWYTVAGIPAGAPPLSADVIQRTFQDLATTHHGIMIEP